MIFSSATSSLTEFLVDVVTLISGVFLTPPLPPPRSGGPPLLPRSLEPPLVSELRLLVSELPPLVSELLLLVSELPPLVSELPPLVSELPLLVEAADLPPPSKCLSRFRGAVSFPP